LILLEGAVEVLLGRPLYPLLFFVLHTLLFLWGGEVAVVYC
jgi:hypothetical protein